MCILTFFSGRIHVIAVTVLFYFLITAQSFAAEAPEVEWERTFGGSGYEQGYCVQQTADGGFIIAATATLIKTDRQGNMLWDVPYGGESIQQTTDGGYIVASGRNGMVLTKLDGSGTKEWQQVFKEDGEGWGKCVRQTLDGGYIIGGDGGDPGTGSFLVKTDANGNEEWRQVTTGSWCAFGYNSVQQTSDGGYILGGSACRPSPCHAQLTKIDAAGNRIWAEDYSTGLYSAHGYCAQQTSAGGYVLVGKAKRRDGDQYDAYLVKTDASGVVQWERTIGGEGGDVGYSIVQAVAGYVIVGATTSYGAGGEDVYLLETDVLGNVLWERTIGGSDNDSGHYIQQIDDGGFVVVGVTRSYGAGSSDVYLIKLRPEGIPDSTHTVSSPNTPSGPSSGQAGESLNFSTSGATCNQGHSVSYRFDWGDGSFSNWSSSTSASHGYPSTGTYQVRAQARCASDTSVVSNWSAAKTVNIDEVPPPPEPHTVSPPNTPSGPSSGKVGESLTFTTGGSTCSLGHSVQYRFDWDNGNYSSWSSFTSASYAYPATGTYQVRARARCASNTSIVSDWSSAKTVTIGQAPPPSHTVSTPNTPNGPSSGQVGESLSFSTGGSTCSQGHSVQYWFDWGNGNYSNWSSSTSSSYAYPATGIYQVRAQARCASNTSIVSDWSSAKTVTIGQAPPPSHAVSTPNAPTGLSSGQVGELLNFSTGGSTCNQGHSVQYQFDWGDGSPYSTWSSSARASHTYSEAGTYQVKAHARCASVKSITSGWSATKTVNIGETPLPENQRPDPPANLAQLEPSGSEIPVGDAVDVDSVVFRAAVTDSDGDSVRLQVELRRLGEFGGMFDETQGGFKESNLVTSGTTTTCTAYGLIDDSYHWRARVVDEHGMISDWVQCGNNNVSEADFTIANNLAGKIDSLLRIGIYVDPYLLTAEGFADSVTTIFLDFTDWLTRTDLTGTYDDLYWLGFDYADLAYVALIRAKRAIEAGDADLASRWYERYEGCSTASRLAFDAALEVFQNHVDIAAQIADGIRQGCQAAVKFGLIFVSPTAAEVADYVYLAVDYGVDQALHGKEVALKNAVIGVLVKGLFDYVEFDAIGGRTLADWSKNRIGKSLFPMLTKVFRNNETMQWAVEGTEGSCC